MGKLLTTREVEIMLGLSPNVLSQWRYRGIGPAYIKLGCSHASPVRYSQEAVEAWLAAHMVSTTSERSVA